jgi:hypothetical protein
MNLFCALAVESDSNQRKPKPLSKSISPGNTCYDSSPESIFICMGDQ